jgi:nicotinamidase/pyrazinamidase
MSGIGIDRETDAIGLVDVQPTFMPGGELAVAEGDAVVPVINRLLAGFAHAFATQDWHPPGHSSFASAHTGRQP